MEKQREVFEYAIETILKEAHSVENMLDNDQYYNLMGHIFTDDFLGFSILNSFDLAWVREFIASDKFAPVASLARMFGREVKEREGNLNLIRTGLPRFIKKVPYSDYFKKEVLDLIAYKTEDPQGDLDKFYKRRREGNVWLEADFHQDHDYITSWSDRGAMYDDRMGWIFFKVGNGLSKAGGRKDCYGRFYIVLEDPSPNNIEKIVLALKDEVVGVDFEFKIQPNRTNSYNVSDQIVVYYDKDNADGLFEQVADILFQFEEIKFSKIGPRFTSPLYKDGKEVPGLRFAHEPDVKYISYGEYFEVVVGKFVKDFFNAAEGDYWSGFSKDELVAIFAFFFVKALKISPIVPGWILREDESVPYFLEKALYQLGGYTR